MSCLNSRQKGYTLVEIMVTSMVLAIVAAAVYATTLSQIKMNRFSKHELEAHMGAAAWLEKVKAAKKYSEVSPAAGSTDLNDAGSILPEDYSAWPLASKVNNLSATYTIIEPDLSPETTFAKPRKITVEIKWDERKPDVSRKALY